MRQLHIVLPFIALSVVVAGPENPNDVRYITVTQKVSHVFGNATDRQVDRIRLLRAAAREFRLGELSASVTNDVCGLKIESIIYSSNRVEAVFSRPCNVINGHP